VFRCRGRLGAACFGRRRVLFAALLLVTVAVSRSTGQAKDAGPTLAEAKPDQSFASGIAGLRARVLVARAKVPRGTDRVEMAANDRGGEGADEVLLSFHAHPSSALSQVRSATRHGDRKAAVAERAVADDRTDRETALDPETARLRDAMRKAFTRYYARPTNTRDRSPWGIMHAIVAFGVDAQVLRDGPHGPPVTAIGWLCYNGRGRGKQLFRRSGNQFELNKGPGVEGHDGQFLAILAQAHVMVDYPIRVDGKGFTVADLVEYEKRTCLPGTELTFKLIGLAHYLDTRATWQNQRGETWSIQRLIRGELAQPIRGAACGGSHRLMGLSYAVAQRARQGQPMVGEFRRAQIFVRDYQRDTLSLQNRDGSFSTAWFQGRENRADDDRKLWTTGHMLEWMVFSLPDEALTDPPIVRAVAYLTGLLLREPNHDWQIGPLGHALHALVLYDQRVFSGTPDDFRSPRTDPTEKTGARTARPSASTAGQSFNG